MNNQALPKGRPSFIAHGSIRAPCASANSGNWRSSNRPCGRWDSNESLVRASWPVRVNGRRRLRHHHLQRPKPERRFRHYLGHPVLHLRRHGRAGERRGIEHHPRRQSHRLQVGKRRAASGKRQAASSKTWGHRTDYEASTGPVADSPDSSTDVSSPGTSLSSRLTAAAPDSATLATGSFVARRGHEVVGGDSAVLPSGRPSQCSSSTIRTPLPTARGVSGQQRRAFVVSDDRMQHDLGLRRPGDGPGPTGFRRATDPAPSRGRRDMCRSRRGWLPGFYSPGRLLQPAAGCCREPSGARASAVSGWERYDSTRQRRPR